ncbi:MAG: hypothetical protein Q4D73_00085 [Actinomycetaceae bacterium]|nr:hypothetical protein [Actinomycetaceae bacterium]
MVDFLNDPQLQDRLAQFNQQVTQLRFAEGLRRNAELVRAETNLHFAKDLAFAEGVRLDLGTLRELSMQTELSFPSVEAQVGYNLWSMQFWVSQLWEPLNPRREKTGGILQIAGKNPGAKSVPQMSLLASLHKLACANLAVPATDISIPNGACLQAFLEIDKLTQVPKFWRLGLQVAQALQSPVFKQANLPVLLTYVRQQLVVTAVEPTGCLQFSAGWVRNLPQIMALVQELQLQATKNQQLKLAFTSAEQVVQWLTLWADLFLESFSEAQQLIRFVQAGRLPETQNNCAQADTEKSFPQV